MRADLCALATVNLKDVLRLCVDQRLIRPFVGILVKEHNVDTALARLAHQFIEHVVHAVRTRRPTATQRREQGAVFLDKDEGARVVPEHCRVSADLVQVVRLQHPVTFQLVRHDSRQLILKDPGIGFVPLRMTGKASPVYAVIGIEDDQPPTAAHGVQRHQVAYALGLAGAGRTDDGGVHVGDGAKDGVPVGDRFLPQNPLVGTRQTQRRLARRQARIQLTLQDHPFRCLRNDRALLVHELLEPARPAATFGHLRHVSVFVRADIVAGEHCAERVDLFVCQLRSQTPIRAELRIREGHKPLLAHDGKLIERCVGIPKALRTAGQPVLHHRKSAVNHAATAVFAVLPGIERTRAKPRRTDDGHDCAGADADLHQQDERSAERIEESASVVGDSVDPLRARVRKADNQQGEEAKEGQAKPLHRPPPKRFEITSLTVVGRRDRFASQARNRPRPAAFQLFAFSGLTGCTPCRSMTYSAKFACLALM